MSILEDGYYWYIPVNDEIDPKPEPVNIWSYGEGKQQVAFVGTDADVDIEQLKGTFIKLEPPK